MIMDFLLRVSLAFSYFFVAVLLAWGLLAAFDKMSPGFKMWAEIRRGNIAVGLAAAGQIIGISRVIDQAIRHFSGALGLIGLTVWGVVGGLLLIIGYLAFEAMSPKLSLGTELAADNRAVGVMAFGIAVATGQLVAGCIS